MSEVGTLARPYAKAAFEYAAAAGDLQGWHDRLHTAALVVGDDKVSDLLRSPVYTVEQQADAVAMILGDELEEPVRNFLAALAKNRRLPLLPKVFELFKAMKDAREQKIDVELISAAPITPEQQQTLVAALSRRLEREVSLSTSVDESLVGGLVVRAGDQIFDGSIRGRLAQLAKALNS